MGIDITIFTQFGPWVGLLLVLLFFLRDKLFPAVIEDRKTRLADEREREDRLYSLIEKNTKAFTEMRGAVEELRDTLTEMRTDLRDVRTDVTFLYARLNVERRPPADQQS